jgi:hypothetical protein
MGLLGNIITPGSEVYCRGWPDYEKDRSNKNIRVIRGDLISEEDIYRINVYGKIINPSDKRDNNIATFLLYKKMCAYKNDYLSHYGSPEIKKINSQNEPTVTSITTTTVAEVIKPTIEGTDGPNISETDRHNTNKIDEDKKNIEPPSEPVIITKIVENNKTDLLPIVKNLFNNVKAVNNIKIKHDYSKEEWKHISITSEFKVSVAIFSLFLLLLALHSTTHKIILFFLSKITFRKGKK